MREGFSPSSAPDGLAGLNRRFGVASLRSTPCVAFADIALSVT